MQCTPSHAKHKELSTKSSKHFENAAKLFPIFKTPLQCSMLPQTMRVRKERLRKKLIYLAPTGQGCFSFQVGLLHRAAQTYSKRNVGNKYELISRWLLTGLAVTISRNNWNPPTPAYSQSLGGEAPGTPQGEAVGQA